MNSVRQNCLAGSLLVWLIILGGCAEREPSKATSQMDAEEQFWIRVLLLDDIRECKLKINSAFAVINAESGMIEARFDAVQVPTVAKLSGGRIVITGRRFASNEVVIFPHKPHIFNLNGSDYRGKLKLIVSNDGNSFDAINLVPLEPYLAGVVGAEMPNYWEPAALQAQAVAARTYGLYIKRHFGERRNWDVRKTQAHQVYLGVAAESAQIWGAVNKTWGEVLVCTHGDGTENIFPTYYSSTCGGHTENSKHVFGDSFEPLAGRDCPYCKDVVRPSFFSWPATQFDKVDVTSKLFRRYPKLKELGEIRDIVAAKQSNYGEFSRLTLVKLSGSTGKSDFLRAEDLRLTIDPSGRKLRSTICRIIKKDDKYAFLSGRGYGHGVGMCQCGAQAMAREGKTAKQILFYYYPRSKVVTVY